MQPSPPLSSHFDPFDISSEYSALYCSRLDSESPISQPQSLCSRRSYSPPSSSRVSFSNSRDSYSKMLSRESSRKRARRNSQSSPEHPLPLWEFHTVFGIVHSSGCNICSPFIAHMEDARRADIPDFKLSLKSRDNQRDLYFFDGVSEGRRRQRSDDESLMRDRARYRAERNDARSASERYKLECYNIAQELSFVKVKLRASQSECDVLRQRIEVLAREKLEHTNQVAKADALEVEEMLFEPNDSPNLPPHDPKADNAAPSFSSTSLPMKPAPETPKDDGPDHSATSATALILPSYANAASSKIPSFPSPSARRPTANLSAPSGKPSPPVILNATDLRTTSAAHNTFNRNPNPNPKSLRHLQAIMAAAHQPGNDAALTRIKALCAEAHQVIMIVNSPLQSNDDYRCRPHANRKLKYIGIFFPLGEIRHIFQNRPPRPVLLPLHPTQHSYLLKTFPK